MSELENIGLIINTKLRINYFKDKSNEKLIEEIKKVVNPSDTLKYFNGWVIQSIGHFFPFNPLYTKNSSLYTNDPVRYVINNLKENHVSAHGVDFDVADLMVGMLGGLKIDIPFAVVSDNNKKSFSRFLSTDANYITIRSLVFVNRWSYALSVRDDGSISNSNKHRHHNGWEGWILEILDGRNVFLSRNKGKGKKVLAVDDDGCVCTTHNRCKNGWEEFETNIHINGDEEYFTFQRVKEPRFYLASSSEGIICTKKDFDSKELAWFLN